MTRLMLFIVLYVGCSLAYQIFHLGISYWEIVRKDQKTQLTQMWKLFYSMLGKKWINWYTGLTIFIPLFIIACPLLTPYQIYLDIRRIITNLKKPVHHSISHINEPAKRQAVPGSNKFGETCDKCEFLFQSARSLPCSKCKQQIKFGGEDLFIELSGKEKTWHEVNLINKETTSYDGRLLWLYSFRNGLEKGNYQEFRERNNKHLFIGQKSGFTYEIILWAEIAE